MAACPAGTAAAMAGFDRFSGPVNGLAKKWTPAPFLQRSGAGVSRRWGHRCRVGSARRAGPCRPIDWQPVQYRGCWQHWNCRSVSLFYTAFPLKYHIYCGGPSLYVRGHGREAGVGHQQGLPVLAAVSLPGKRAGRRWSDTAPRARLGRRNRPALDQAREAELRWCEFPLAVASSA